MKVMLLQSQFITSTTKKKKKKKCENFCVPNISQNSLSLLVMSKEKLFITSGVFTSLSLT